MNKYKRKGFLLHAKGKEYKSKVKRKVQRAYEQLWEHTYK